MAGTAGSSASSGTASGRRSPSGSRSGACWSWRTPLGTVGYFTAPGEAIGVHPLLRLRPPRDLGELEPEHILCGHGAGVHGPAATAALREALATSRRRLPRALASGLRRRKS